MSYLGEEQQERRITFRLYDSWEKIAGESGIPALKDLSRDDIEPFRKNLVLIDMREGQEKATFQVLGNDLVKDQDENLVGKSLSHVPRKTMLSRVTDHYLEVLSNRVPIAFEAEFINRDDDKALYRGILLPFSDDGTNINFILGGVRWILAKDVKLDEDKPSIEELMKSIAAGREDTAEDETLDEVVSDNKIEEVDEYFEIETEEEQQEEYIEIEDTPSFEESVINEITADLEQPLEEETEVETTPTKPIAEVHEEPAVKVEPADLNTELKKTRKYINKQDTTHNRSRDALYNILTAIYKFHEIANLNYTSYKELVADNNLKIQVRAPFTPALKLCLGKEYDKTRLTEYAAALGIAQHLGVSTEDFHDFIKNFPGGIKGCVQEMRALRKGMPSSNSKKQTSLDEAKSILNDLPTIGSLQLEDGHHDIEDYSIVLVRKSGESNQVIKILDEKHTKIDPILKRAAFIKGNSENGA